MENVLLATLFSALKILALELTDTEQLTVISEIPLWAEEAFRDLHAETESLSAEALSPFLSNFMIDAEGVWQRSSTEVLQSGLWSETKPSGEDALLEAIALSLDSRKIILIQSAEQTGEEKIKWLQTAREERLSFDSQQKSTADRLFNATFYDALTGLPNRSLFSSQLETLFDECQWQPGRQFAVIVVNIDRFQSINNSLGTAAGDRVLITVASRIGECLRKPDIPVRFGSDEFGILLNHIETQQDVTNIVERLLESITQPFLIDGHRTHFTASAGIAISEDWYQHSRDLLRDASLALQQAKASGRGHYQIFNREMRTQAFELWDLESSLRTAIEREQLQLCYQPIVDLKTQRIERFEALVRWEHPTQGWISPSKFIPLAEESGLILALDSWVIKMACQTIQQWETATGQSVQLNVNISPKHFEEGDLLAAVQSGMQPSQITPKSLCLEITESSLLANRQNTIKTLNQLQALGINLAIDDFGTGYASLSYLQDLPLDIIKIDGYFIKMMDDDNSSEIVQTIIHLGHKLGLTITAEQVETLSQYKALRELGCDTVQGYLLS
ncbi:MAG: bifunctional diguanylate cyclase/phosphodiesterase, partial [Cyanobacteria bacterium J06560_2]